MTATEAMQAATSQLLAGRRCAVCGKPTGSGRRMYCGDRCRKEAIYMQVWRRRWKREKQRRQAAE